MTDERYNKLLNNFITLQFAVAQMHARELDREFKRITELENTDRLSTHIPPQAKER